MLSEQFGLQELLKVERDAPALVVLGSSFHQRGTTNENSLDCRTCTDGSAKQRSLDERSILGVTFALTRALGGSRTSNDQYWLMKKYQSPID